MSEVAGRMAIVNGAFYLQKTKGGKGKLMSGVPGVNRVKVLVLGGGTVGEAAARMAAGMELMFGLQISVCLVFVS